MNSSSEETDARVVIEGLSQKIGWNPADKSQVLTEWLRQASDGPIMSSCPTTTAVEDPSVLVQVIDYYDFLFSNLD